MPGLPPTDPPPEKMVRELTAPDHSVGYYSELVSREGARFQQLSPIKRGTHYASTIGADQRIVDLFGANLIFLGEKTPVGGGDVRGMPGDQFVIWQWATDSKTDSTYGDDAAYLAEATAYPVFTRVYTIRRDDWLANPTLPVGQPLTALLGVKVLAGGTGYQNGDAVVIPGNATAEIVVDENGSVSNVIITDEGSGYDSAALPTITVTSATGSGVSLLAIVQPKTAVLVSQKKSDLPQAEYDMTWHEYVQVTRVYRATTGPILTDYVFDQRYGVLFTVAQGDVPAGTVGGSVLNDNGSVEVSEIKAHDTVISEKIVTRVASIPDTQVFYGRRRENLPIVLASVSVVGTEELEAIPHYKYPPDGPLKSRTTRSFSYGPPTEPSAPTLAELFAPQPFHGAVEYSLARATTNASTGSHAASETSSGTSSGTESATHSSTGSSTNSGTHSGTNSGTSSNTESGTHGGTSSNTSSGTESGTSSGTHSGTQSSTGSGTESGTHSSASSRDSTSDDGTTTSNTGAPLVGDPQNNRHSVSSESSTQNQTSNSTTNSTHNGTTNGTQNATNNSTHNGTTNSTQNSTGNGTTNSTSNSTGNGTENSTGNSTSNGTSNSTSNGTRNSTTNSTANTTASSNNNSTGKTLLRVGFPPTLHAQITVYSGLVIPATTPTDLPWGEWVTVADSPDHWKNGIWVREKVEVLLPVSP